jgi:hypothetical protein
MLTGLRKKDSGEKFSSPSAQELIRLSGVARRAVLGLVWEGVVGGWTPSPSTDHSCHPTLGRLLLAKEPVGPSPHLAITPMPSGVPSWLP